MRGLIERIVDSRPSRFESRPLREEIANSSRVEAVGIRRVGTLNGVVGAIISGAFVTAAIDSYDNIQIASETAPRVARYLEVYCNYALTAPLVAGAVAGGAMAVEGLHFRHLANQRIRAIEAGEAS